MKFKFEKDKHDYSGRIAFTGPSTSRLLLLTGVGHDAVHVIAGGFGGPGGAGGAVGQLYQPNGLRFTGDGTGLADASNGRVSVWRMGPLRDTWPWGWARTTGGSGPGLVGRAMSTSAQHLLFFRDDSGESESTRTFKANLKHNLSTPLPVQTTTQLTSPAPAVHQHMNF
jgi:hypothetical protein